MIQDLRIEYRKDPIGIDCIPRFSWKLMSDKKNVVQKEYRIQVKSKDTCIWDTGFVESSQSILIPYTGETLTPFTQYQVCAMVSDNYGEESKAEGYFETGLLTKENWRAQWITHSLPKDETVSPVFTKQFGLRGTIKNARLYAAARGVYEAALNGKRVGDAFLAPGWTSYHHRIQYQTYDITEMILEDQNEIAITLGNGWYKGYLGFDEKPDHYGSQTALLAMIRMEYEDGSVKYIGTDTDWMVQTGQIRYSEIYHGETQDFTKPVETIGNALLFSADTAFGDVTAVKNEEGAEEAVHTTLEITAQESEPVRVTRRFPAKEKIITPKGELVLDFGQNMAGIVEIVLPPLKGDKLVVRHAETLDRDGNFYTENLRSAKCTDTYLYGKEQEGMTVFPRFTFHGFRYICLEGVDPDVEINRFTACALHTDMEETGDFQTDNALINQLQSNIKWGQRSNFLDIPTDCPQRNERLGWTGDAQVFSGTASYNFHTFLFFRKWLHDMAVETTLEWGVPHVIPNILGDQAGATAWSDAAVIIPWTLYQIYGDQRILEEQFECMKTWVEYIRRNCLENGLWQTGFQYGDWLALDIESGSTERTGGTDKHLVANAYYALSARIVRDAAHVLGLRNEEQEYTRLYEEILEAVNREFVTASGRLVSETQTACVLMLHFDLVKPEFRQRILSTLELNIGAHHNHLTTGFVGTPYLCHCLTENGKHDLAEAVFLKEDFPGWFYAVKKGATTIWERWNSILPDGCFDQSGMNSLNHYAYGAIGSWMYEKIAGIRPLEPGYKKILIQPQLTHGMTEAKGRYESVYGTIESAWSCRNGKITVDITIPPNTTAVVRLPEKTEAIEAGSGHYRYEYETNTSLEQDFYTMESTLGELVGEKLGRQMFEQMVPGMLDNPMIQFAYDMTISELLVQAPEAKPLYQAVIDALNQNRRSTLKNSGEKGESSQPAAGSL